jgi:hypothetical protein
MADDPLVLRRPKIETLQTRRGLFLGWSAVVTKSA